MDDRTELIEKVERQYLGSGFIRARFGSPNGRLFQNAFSVQAVFLVDDEKDLDGSWVASHEELIGVYRSHEGFVDMEWNFYCVYIVLRTNKLPDLVALKSRIENDTSYSRKFVITGLELHLLPPGRVDSGLAKAAKLAQSDPIGQWTLVLGEELLEKVSGTPFTKLREMLAEVVDTEAADVGR